MTAIKPEVFNKSSDKLQKVLFKIHTVVFVYLNQTSLKSKKS